MAQAAPRRATSRLPAPPQCTSDPRRRPYRKGARPAESPDPGPGVAPALAPLIVPHARKLPHGFLLHTDERDLLRQACDLGRQLARDGSLTLLPPEEGENVIHHLGRCWAAQYQAALDASDVHLDLDWGRPWHGEYPGTGSTACCSVSTPPVPGRCTSPASGRRARRFTPGCSAAFFSGSITS